MTVIAHALAKSELTFSIFLRVIGTNQKVWDTRCPTNCRVGANGAPLRLFEDKKEQSFLLKSVAKFLYQKSKNTHHQALHKTN